MADEAAGKGQGYGLTRLLEAAVGGDGHEACKAPIAESAHIREPRRQHDDAQEGEDDKGSRRRSTTRWC